jgi:enoyl-CoA hydratase
MDSVFGLHHLAHAHNAEVGADSLAGQDARSMRDARQRDERPAPAAPVPPTPAAGGS